jgi:predicted short-subunit dehydrogenase-like oxidoreductase (DUF2520 family)
VQFCASNRADYPPECVGHFRISVFKMADSGLSFRSSAAVSARTVVVLGAGHVATHLAPALAAAGHRIVGGWGRDSARAAQASALAPDLVLVAVPDHAVAATIAAAGLPPHVAVAHTAGALPLPDHPRAGVFYPLQTFSATRALDLSNVPFFLEATDGATAALLEDLARAISPAPPRWLTAAERAPLHLAAVFAANFVNHLLGVSQRVLAVSGNSVPFDVLRPLVAEVVEKAFTAPDGPFSAQTGPARRADAPTLAAHRTHLLAHASLAPWAAIYDALSAEIQRVAAPAAAANPVIAPLEKPPAGA